MTDSPLPIRDGLPQDFAPALDLLHAAFHNNPDPDLTEIERGVYEPARSLAVVDDGRIVGHAGAYTRELTVPGAVVPAAHVTMVAVAATHRRRGLLTRLMRRQLRQVRDQGREPIAVLWASEGRIYPRFGYGLAAERLIFDIDLRELRLPADAGDARLRSGDPDELRPEMATVYERLRPGRPGWSSRDDRWWRNVLADPPARRESQTALRAVLHDGPGGVDGYALWRSRGGWDTRGPKAHVQVIEVAATEPPAYLALWRFLTTIDLSRSVGYSFGAVDEPLIQLVDEPRQLGATLADSLWVRLVDVAAALEARRYAAAVDLVIDVTDPLVPENTGRWRLTGDRERARCVPSTEPSDLACDVRDLGAVYLGGSSLRSLADAGLIRELRHGAVAEATIAFGWDRSPAGVEIF
ncbi:GNAT family N-acetyltransferase [Solwaraspora sp. WMMD406]|uniref:GNAT family N-acetyltransferase n=1 Tax=Solwaraspora sp. WMMD406 TaxID=3016095 RepID=UPI0024160B46|nr:GNAT family N-acetyltransferase [Solwaraspora sp. WMMD406]MDG4764584.1 GNAT family N-acetyltransferase [Solwaraspora sp. WMMD406]